MQATLKFNRTFQTGFLAGMTIPQSLRMPVELAKQTAARGPREFKAIGGSMVRDADHSVEII